MLFLKTSLAKAEQLVKAVDERIAPAEAVPVEVSANQGYWQWMQEVTGVEGATEL